MSASRACFQILVCLLVLVFASSSSFARGRGIHTCGCGFLNDCPGVVEPGKTTCRYNNQTGGRTQDGVCMRDTGGINNRFCAYGHWVFQTGSDPYCSSASPRQGPYHRSQFYCEVNRR